MHLLTAILFPAGAVRLSTAVGLGAFGVLALARRDWRPLLAAAVWMIGYEAAFGVGVSFGHDRFRLGLVHSFIWLAIGAVATPALARIGIRTSWRWLLAGLAVWAVWVATGFHVNFHNGTNFDPTAEVLNEVSKTLWALAYFLPLLHVRKAKAGASVGGHAGASAVRSTTNTSSTRQEISNKLRTTRRVSKGATGWTLPAPKR